MGGTFSKDKSHLVVGYRRAELPPLHKSPTLRSHPSPYGHLLSNYSLIAGAERGDVDDERNGRSGDGVNHGQVMPFTVRRDTVLLDVGTGKDSLVPLRISDIECTQNISLCSRRLVTVTLNLALLQNATTLRLCCNELTHLPEEIGYLKNLRVLNLSKNKLKRIPESIGYLSKLVDLDIAENQLEVLPKSIGCLKRLGILKVDHNQLIMLPSELGLVKNLKSLDVSWNRVRVIPAEVGRLKHLRKVVTECCGMMEESEVGRYMEAVVDAGRKEQARMMGAGKKLGETPLVPSSSTKTLVNEPIQQPTIIPSPTPPSPHPPTTFPPTLRELSARIILRHELPIPTTLSPSHLQYLQSSSRCSYCAGPYFTSVIYRYRTVEKNEVKLPLEYRLCRPHWDGEEERIGLLFWGGECTRPKTDPWKWYGEDENGMAATGSNQSLITSTTSHSSNSSAFSNSTSSTLNSMESPSTRRLPNTMSHFPDVPRPSSSRTATSTLFTPSSSSAASPHSATACSSQPGLLPHAHTRSEYETASLGGRWKAGGMQRLSMLKRDSDSKELLDGAVTPTAHHPESKTPTDETSTISSSSTQQTLHIPTLVRTSILPPLPPLIPYEEPPTPAPKSVSSTKETPPQPSTKAARKRWGGKTRVKDVVNEDTAVTTGMVNASALNTTAQGVTLQVATTSNGASGTGGTNVDTNEDEQEEPVIRHRSSRLKMKRGLRTLVT